MAAYSFASVVKISVSMESPLVMANMPISAVNQADIMQTIAPLTS